MTRKIRWLPVGIVLAISLVIGINAPSRAEILNGDEYGWLEVRDLSMIEEAAGMFPPVSLRFNVGRGGPMYTGDEIVIYYHGVSDKYVSIIDYSPDRIVKPLVFNEHTMILDGLNREFVGTVGDVLGKEHVLQIVTNLPLTDEELQAIALAPNEIEIGEMVIIAAVSDFNIVGYGSDPDYERYDAGRVEMIELEEFAIYIDYPLNRYPYNPWPYMYLYPYARFQPMVYMERFGPLTKTWYVFPGAEQIESNFWDYAYTGWIEDGHMVVPPGGYWQGTFRIDDPYSPYWLRILPYLIRENTSYANLQVQINGTLVEPSFDITGAIGWGEHWTTDPFAYYSVERLLRRGENTFRLYWPEEEEYDLELQMLDIVPSEVMEEEMAEAQEAAETEEVEGE